MEGHSCFGVAIYELTAFYNSYTRLVIKLPIAFKYLVGLYTRDDIHHGSLLFASTIAITIIETVKVNSLANLSPGTSMPKI